MNELNRNVVASIAPVPRLSLNTEDAAKALGVSKRQLLALKSAGELPFIELSRQTFVFDPDDLAAWLKGKKQKSNPDDSKGRRIGYQR